MLILSPAELRTERSAISSTIITSQIVISLFFFGSKYDEISPQPAEQGRHYPRLNSSEDEMDHLYSTIPPFEPPDHAHCGQLLTQYNP